MVWTPLKSNWSPGSQFASTDENAVAAAINAIVGGATAAQVNTSETTTSTTYTDLATVTDSVTVTIGSSGIALVLFSAAMYDSTTAGQYMSFAMSGANTQAASDAYGIFVRPYSTAFASQMGQFGNQFLLTGLLPGATTFKAKYRSFSAGTATFLNRNIAVIPFP